MTSYLPSRNYLYLGSVAIALSALCGYMAVYWPVSAVPSGLFFTTAALNFFLYFRPVIEIRPVSITIGKFEYLWSEVLRIERTGWISPLIFRLVLKDGRRLLVIYPGALTASRKLAEEMGKRLYSSRTDFPEVDPVSNDDGDQPSPPFLNAEDAAEVERLFQRLKSVGHLEPGSPEEK